jgi:hypothetical protein
MDTMTCTGNFSGRLHSLGCLTFSAILLAVGCGSNVSSGEYPTPPDCADVGPTDEHEYTAILRPTDTSCTEKLEQEVEGVLPLSYSLVCGHRQSGGWY